MALNIFNKERNKFTIPGNSEDIEADSINSVQTSQMSHYLLYDIININSIVLFVYHSDNKAL